MSAMDSDSKTNNAAHAGRMTRLVQRLSSHVAMMAPHQKERQGGELLAEMQALLGPLQPWQIEIMEALTDPTRKLCVAHGRMVEAGDDEDGQPRIVIHSTKESLAAVNYLPIYEDALILISPMNDQLAPPTNGQPESKKDATGG